MEAERTAIAAQRRLTVVIFRIAADADAAVTPVPRTVAAAAGRTA